MVQLRTVREAYERQELALAGDDPPEEVPGITRLAALTGKSAMGVMDDVVTLGDDIAHRWAMVSTQGGDLVTFLGLVYAYGYVAGIEAEGAALGYRVRELEKRTEELARSGETLQRMLASCQPDAVN